MRTCILIATLSLIFQLGFPQSNYRFRHFDTRDGLVSEASSYILQDSLGFIWTFYQGGLSTGALTRFDGYNFKVYNFDPTDSLSSPGPWIDRIQVDRNGNLWVIRYPKMSSDDSLSLMQYDKKTDSFKKIKPPLNGAHISYVSFAKDEPVIWLTTWSGEGLFRFNYKTNEIKNYPLRNSLVHAEDYGRFLLVATNQGIWRFDKITEKFSRPRCNPKDSSLFYSSSGFFIFSVPNFDYNNLWVVFLGKEREMVRIDSNFSITGRFRFPPELNLQSIFRDEDNVIWIVGNGMYRYNPKDNSLIHITKEEGDPYSLSTNNIADLWIDRDQNKWVATDKGISMLKKQNLTFYNHKINKSGPIATYEANGMDFLMVTKREPWPPKGAITNEIYVTPIFSGHLDSLHFQKMPTPLQIHGDNIRFAKGKHDFWIGSQGGGLTRIPVSTTTGMIESQSATQWHPNPKNLNSLSSDNVLGMFEEHGNLWVGTLESGVNKIALNIPYGEPGSVTRHVHTSEDSNSVASNMAFGFFPAEKNSLWVITKSGIDLFHDGRFEHVDKKEKQVYKIFKAPDGTTYMGTTDGLYASGKDSYPYRFEKDPAIKDYGALGLYADKLNRLWLSNYQGTMMYDRKENLMIEFTKEDGINHTFENIARTSQGLLIMTDPRGVSIFDPSSLTVSRNKTYPVLTKLLINNRLPVVSNRPAGKEDFTIAQDINMLKTLVIDYQHNNFVIEFSAMQMTAPKENLYRYKLENYDNDWIQTDWKNRTATYTNLDAGHYTFRVKASNHHGVWSDQERTLAITVLPPPWKTVWAYTGYGLLVIGLLWVARRTIVQRERLKSNLKLEHVELEKAKEVDRVKTSFFTNISHEFRTPLTLIKGPVQNLLEEFSDNPKIKERLKLVQRNSDLLLKLVNQLLDLAKLESGSLQVEMSEGDLNSFVSAVASAFSSFAQQKNIQLTVDLPATRYLAVFDKDKLETILINLINNAIKFTPAGGTVSVVATLEKLDHQENRDQLVVIVKDTGIGIPEEQHGKIFERFHQVSEAHKEVGTGIGLALVKELTVLLQGSIVVKSKPGEGSEFKLTLPIERRRDLTKSEEWTESKPEVVTDGKGVRETQEVDPDASAKPHVLVVEDNTDLRRFIIDSLGNEFHFMEAGDGKQGLDIATREVPDLIISDVMMPEMDGITMTGKIKKDIRTSHIPLILLTAKSTEDSKLTGLSSGADDYLTKPFNKNELLLKVRNRIIAQAKIREKIKLELLKEAPKVEVQSADEQFLFKVKEAILERLGDEQLSVESLAEEVGLSRSQLFRKISALTGVSVNELIRTFRLQKAAQLLEQNWGPVSQVAYEVGFSNLSYFSKVFKEEYGVLPSEYPAEKT